SGDIGEGLQVAGAARERARDRRLTTWERRLSVGIGGLHWHSGELGTALDECRALIDEIGPRGRFGVWTSQVFADVGRHEESVAIARQVVAEALPTWQSLGEALWALCDAELAAGNPRRAIAAADELRDRFGNQGPTVFAQITRAWARHDLGLEPDGEPFVATQPIVEGAPAELRGVTLLSRGDAAGAAARFAEAAALWRGRHFRGHLRCRWAEGEAVRRSGDASAAVAALEQAEAVAVAHGEVSTLRRIRRSLRLAGARRSADRGAAGNVTLREREVLELVADGLSNSEIARRLGVGRSTVERLLQSASRKLGARTRGQAAALFARE
ncbi:MAG: LuxR C-terminal-related transcriptional regulator, partial [Actinomycetota bacterium]